MLQLKKSFLYIFYLNLILFPVVQARQIGSDKFVSKQAKSYFPNEENNSMLGFSIFRKGFLFENGQTNCTFDSYFPVSGDIVLNGGTLSLNADIYFQNPLAISGGLINGNFFSILLPHNVNKIYLPSLNHDKGIVLAEKISFSKRVFATDWSFDGKYLAIGLDGGSDDELQLFELQPDGTLLLKDSVNLGSSNDVRAVRWHPSSYYLATGSTSGNELQIWLFDPNTPSIVETDNANINDVISLAWTHDGNYLAVGRNSTSSIYLYPFSNGALGTLVSGSLGSWGRVYDLDWKTTDDYLVVGLKKVSGTKEIKIFEFNGSSLTLDAQLETNANVYTVKWRPNDSVFVAGLGTSSEQLRTYQFSSGVITEIASARVGETKAVFDAAWNGDGCFLSTVKDSDSNGFEVEVFCYDVAKQEYHLVTGYNLGLDGESLSWSYSDNYIAVSDCSKSLYIFSFEQRPLIFKNSKLVLDAQTDLTGALYFEGDCAIKGNGNVVDLGLTGSIIIKENSSLVLQDVVLDGLAGSNIRCLGDSSELTLNNVLWLQDSYFTFTCGALTFENKIKLKGNSIFAYQSSQTSTLAMDSSLHLSPGFTFSFDPQFSNKKLIYFTDSSSELVLDGATMYTTTAGISFEKGTLIVKNNSNLSTERLTIVSEQDDDENSVYIDEGIIFGDGQVGLNDFSVNIKPAARLNMLNGSLEIRNTDDKKIRLFNAVSSLYMKAGSSLKIYNDLDIQEGKIFFEGNSVLAMVNGLNVNVSIAPLGKIRRQRLVN